MVYLVNGRGPRLVLRNAILSLAAYLYVNPGSMFSWILRGCGSTAAPIRRDALIQGASRATIYRPTRREHLVNPLVLSLHTAAVFCKDWDREKKRCTMTSSRNAVCVIQISAITYLLVL